jgi:beta-N-acetylhexosaminidase
VLPASLSEATVGGSLRGDLGWDGPVVTDDLQAGAIRDAYPDEEVVRLAIAAGNDLLLFANQQVFVPDVARRVVDIAVDLVARGRLEEARIDAALARIAAARDGAGA